MKQLSLAVWAFAALSLALTAVPASAEEPPPDGAGTEAAEEAPQAEAAQAEAAQAEAAQAEAKPDGTAADPAPWSNPAVPTATPAGTSSLPPPRVIRRTGTQRATGAGARTASATPATPRIRDIPATTSGGVRAVPPPLPRPPAPLGVSPTTRRAPPPSGRPSTTRNPNRVVSVLKTHNVPSRDDPQDPGDLLLQLDVAYEVVNQGNQDVYVAIWFADKATGKLLRSTGSAYADSNGLLTLQTLSSRVMTRTARYDAVLRIPYRAFPGSPAGTSYEVEARVQVLRRERGQRVTPLARGQTTFRVYGDPTPEEVERPQRVEGSGARAFVGETGVITNPGGDRTGTVPQATPSETGIIEER